LHTLQRPDEKIEVLSGKRLADEIEDIAKQQNINLSMADMKKTKEILKSISSSLSDDIIETRELNEEAD
jgi:hypothetical protein